MTVIIISLLLLVSLPPLLAFTAHVGIVNGNEAKAHSRPYMVSVQNKSKHHICGGFLISKQFVLTAAHCQKKREKLTVVVGAHDLNNKNDGSVRIQVISYHKKDFKRVTFENDLMLLKLAKTKLSKNVKTILLPKKEDNEHIKSGTLCTVAGWGSQLTSGPKSNCLMEANVEIMENKECFEKWEKRPKNINAKFSVSKMICVSGRGGSCHGDSGGPLVCGGIAVGVTSFGDPKN